MVDQIINKARMQELFDYIDGKLIYKDGTPSSESLDTYGHLQIWVEDRLVLVHRAIWAWHYEVVPPLIDHRDRNPVNNKIENLRELSYSFNTVNSDTFWGKIPYRGVSLHKESGKYRARIRKDGHLKSLGLYLTPEAAAQAYEDARQTLFPGAYMDVNQLEFALVPNSDTPPLGD